MAKRVEPDQRVPVTKAALMQRLQRALAKEGQVLKVTRGARAIVDLGRHYVIDVRRNVVIDKNVDLEALSRDLGVLRPWEKLAE